MPTPDTTTRLDRHARERQLAATYSGDAWARVADYRRVQQYQADNPDDGYYATATALDMNEYRVRNWVARAGQPDPVRAIETADAHGWLDAEPGDRVFEALSLLVAWTYAGGNITADTYSLTLTVSDADPGPLARECLTATGMKVETMHTDVAGRATDYRPHGPGRSHLGRFLVGVLGAPLGAKAEQRLTVPGWLADAPLRTRTRWVQLYVTLRGTTAADSEWVVLKEQRNRGYSDALGALMQSVVDDPDNIRIGQDSVFIRPQIAHLFEALPRLPSE